ncbi:MAG TPA: OB-fold domain-containing protein, partial [Candidatus Dormibacteraeota bacterium]|nr:OB-fold domain-containing protein [Candidatus Dormibacteraeota bacterium]
WTVCYFAAQEFLKEVPFALALVEFDQVDTLFLSRLVGVERDEIKIGMKVKAKFRRKATWSARDVYFIKSV